jgi:hypothetical protein
MKVFFTCLAAGMLFSCCSKLEHGSKYTKDMSGNHTFRRIYSGTHPYTGYFSDTAIITVNIVCKNTATVVFEDRTFSYVSTDADVLHYQYKDDSKLAWGDLYYDHVANTIKATIDWHVSAAAGDWGYYYQSQ